jgi:predicted naringenin-chalcone synthase
MGISTAVPENELEQMDIYKFMQRLYTLEANDERKHELLYQRSGIQKRYSCVPDYDLTSTNKLLYDEDAEINIAPTLEKRMSLYQRFAMPLAIKAIDDLLLQNKSYTRQDITHIITVSCTGMSAPGLDLQLMEALQLSSNVIRTSINFMGCYAAIHALKMAQQIAETSNENVNIVLVATELCTLHFQQEYSIETASSSMLFADGCAAVLLNNYSIENSFAQLKFFFSKVNFTGKKDMAWQLSSTGFLMTLSGYIPQIIEADIQQLVADALQQYGLEQNQITHWCIHPGGKKIVDVIQQQLNLTNQQVEPSRKVLREYGNMSSPTILFVLKEILEEIKDNKAIIFGIAFGPGLTMETFIAIK